MAMKKTSTTAMEGMLVTETILPATTTDIATRYYDELTKHTRQECSGSVSGISPYLVFMFTNLSLKKVQLMKLENHKL